MTHTYDSYVMTHASLDWMQPNDDYAIRNLTVEAETDWRYCFPTLNMHHQRNKIDGAKDSFLYYFDAPSSLRLVFKFICLLLARQN